MSTSIPYIKPKNRPHYVDNKRLYGEMIHFINQCDEATRNGDPRPKVPEYIGECIFKIATRTATKPNFSSYTYKDEMICDGIEVCIRYIHNFNPEKSNNPFAYFTQIVMNAFIQRIHKEKKQQYIKLKSFENSAVMNTLVEDPTGRYFDTHVGIESHKISEFEGKMKKKKKIKPTGLELFIGDNE